MSNATEPSSFAAVFNRREIKRIRADVETVFGDVAEGMPLDSLREADAEAAERLGRAKVGVYLFYMVASKWLINHDPGYGQRVSDEEVDDSSVRFRLFRSENRDLLAGAAAHPMASDGLRTVGKATVLLMDRIHRLDVAIHADSAVENIAGIRDEFCTFFEHDETFAGMRGAGWSLEIGAQPSGPTHRINARLSDGGLAYTLGRTGPGAYYVRRHSPVANDNADRAGGCDRDTDGLLSSSLRTQEEALKAVADDCGFELAPPMSPF
jgi:hypothetical protein